MENEEKLLEFFGTASERTGALAGKVATIGGKIAGLASGGLSAGKEMLGLAEEKAKSTSEKKSDNIKTSIHKSELAAARRKLAKVEKANSNLESQLKELKAENHMLASELDQMRGELNELQSRESAIRARAVALESELDNTRGQLEDVQSEPTKKTTARDDQSEQVAVLESKLVSSQGELEAMGDKLKETQSNFESRLEKIEAEKEKLLSDVEKIQNKSEKAQNKLKSKISNLKLENKSLKSEVKQLRSDDGETAASEKLLRKQTSELEAKLATTEQKLVEMRKKVKRTQSKFNKKLRGLQEKKESLVFDLEQAQKKAGDERIRADSMESQIAALESNVTTFGLGLEEIRKEESEIDVEIVEEPKAKSTLDSEDRADSEEIEHEPLPGVEVRETVKVTAEDVQTCDFENATDRIIFMRALSDFDSTDTAARVGAARAIAGIAHKLSAQVLIAHITCESSAVVRQECIKALTTLEMPEGLSAVESALTDEMASVRLAAVWGIYRLAGIESLPKLLGMLSDNDEGVRRRCVTCIGWLGGQLNRIGKSHFRKVVSSLIKCLDDSVESVRKATVDALPSVTGKQMTEPVLASRNSLKHLTEQWQNWWKAKPLG